MAATTSWNSLNCTGELFLIGAQAKNSPFLSMIGGVNGAKTYEDVRFPTAQPWSLSAASQPAITETASLTAPTATTYARGQDYNTTQIFQSGQRFLRCRGPAGAAWCVCTGPDREPAGNV